MIDSNETIIYESGKDSGYQEGYDDCKEEMKEIIESMACEIAEHRYPKQYAYNEDQIKSIMSEFGYTEWKICFKAKFKEEYFESNNWFRKFRIFGKRDYRK